MSFVSNFVYVAALWGLSSVLYHHLVISNLYPDLAIGDFSFQAPSLDVFSFTASTTDENAATAVSDDPKMEIIKQFVDLEKYPLHNLDSERGRELIADIRKQLKEGAACTLPGFLKPAAYKKAAEQAYGLKDSAYRSNNVHNIYLEDDNKEFHEKHIRRDPQKSSKNCVSYDLIPEDNPVRIVYEWDPVTDFLAAVLGKDKMYRTADPLGALNIHVYDEGDQLGWHYDRGQFAVTLLLQKPNDGGFYDYVPNIRNPKDENYDVVNKVVRSRKHPRIRTLDIEPGTLVFFQGKYSIHRVTPVQGDRSRILSVLSFETKPDVHLNEYTRLKFFGRKSPDEPINRHVQF
eukprot:GFYU01015977.1.p1 GENE.GFYU01015977.1~~GFYU01015977.1.p1  ORF type:complete len:346 (-),score=110.18 GFYU01015977.1:159-1196(-)